MRLKYLFGEFELNPATRELLRSGRAVAMRPRSLECLVYLIEHRDRAVGRDELISAVWGRVDAGDTVVAQALLRARKALDDTGSQQGMIRTVPRFGYRWVAPVQEVAIAFDGDAADVAPALPALGDDVDTEIEAKEAAEAPSPATNRRLPRFLEWPALVVLMVALGLGVALYLHTRDPAPTSLADDVVLVMPMTVVPVDSETAWVRLGAMDYMSERLRSSGMTVVPSEQALHLGAAIEGDAPAQARATLRALSGARWIARPEAIRGANGWRVRLRVVEGDAERSVEARGETPLAAAAGAADAWLRQLGGPHGATPLPTRLTERLHRIDAEIVGGRLVEARRLVRSASPAERRDPRFLLREARLAFRAGDLDDAARLYRSVLAQVTASDSDTKVGALVGLGTVERAQGHLDAADQHFTESLALHEATSPDRGKSRMIGVTYQGRGIIRVQRGEIDAGVKDMGQGRVWLQRSGDPITLSVIGHNLGIAEAMRGDHLQALNEFDRSIETFERFRVHDHLANSLHEKAEVQLALARPAEAWTTIRRADPLLPKLEDDSLAAEVLSTKARAQLALGRLGEVAATLTALRARAVEGGDPRLLELSLRLQLARGDVAMAHRLAGAGPAPTGVADGLRLAAVQAALRARDLPLARVWLAAAARQGERERAAPAFAPTLARALLARATGDRAGAIAQAEKAAALIDGRASPEVEIQAGVTQALALLEAKDAPAASSILGELEKYEATDYRVAWVMTALYGALGDPRAAASARDRAKTLRGERDPALEPIL